MGSHCTVRCVFGADADTYWAVLFQRREGSLRLPLR